MLGQNHLRSWLHRLNAMNPSKAVWRTAPMSSLIAYNLTAIWNESATNFRITPIWKRRKTKPTVPTKAFWQGSETWQPKRARQQVLFAQNYFQLKKKRSTNFWRTLRWKNSNSWSKGSSATSHILFQIAKKKSSPCRAKWRALQAMHFASSMMLTWNLATLKMRKVNRLNCLIQRLLRS